MGIGLLSESAIDGSSTAHGVASLLQLVADSAGAAGATLTLSHGSTQLGAITSDALQEYIAPYMDPDRPHDPRPARVNPRSDEGFRLDQDDFSAAELARDPYYQEFLSPLGFGWHACALIDGASHSDAMHLTLRRKTRQGCFDQEGLRTLSAQLPLIRATVRPAMMSLYGPGQPPVDSSRRALLGFDAAGSAFVVNSSGDADRVLRVRGGRLAADQPGQALRAYATFERATALARPVSTILTDAGDSWWLFTVVPAAQLAPAGVTPFMSWATLAPYEPSPAAELARVRQLAAIFGLTPAEARVAGLIGDAKSVQAAARILSLAPGTVRNHLKVVFTKVGVSRQAELVAVLSRL